jgi:V8-like Glu-specific endopeptidase
MTNFKNAICRINVKKTVSEYSFGTGFFISKKLILTCEHVIKELAKDENIEVSLKNQSEKSYDAKIIAKSEQYDMAILEIMNEEITDIKILNLINTNINEGVNLKLFGFPNSGNYKNPGDERITGIEITGNINTLNDDFNDNIKHDLVLDFETNLLVDHAGISGSPLLNANNEVVGIFKRQADLSFGGISIKRAIKFLNQNKIQISNQNISFEPYSSDLFKGYNPDVEKDCESQLKEVKEEIEPNKIVEELRENLFYPSKKNMSVDMIINHIQNDPKCCKENFWKGWLEILTYVKMINGDSTNLNNINFDLKFEDLKELFNLPDENELVRNHKMNGKLSIILSFYFIEEDCFFDVAKKVIRQQKEANVNTCTVLNSHQRNFNRRRFTLTDKNAIVGNIADPNNSGFQIRNKVHFGVLPLEELSSKVACSTSLEDANINLKQLFKDAIK